MDEDKKKALKKFVQDPEWHYMEEFINENFEISDSVQTIDTNKAESVIIGDVVARQRIKELLNNVNRAFGTLKQEHENSGRRKLK